MKLDLMHIKQACLKLISLIAPVLLLMFSITCLAAPVLATGLYDLPDFNSKDVWVVDTADAISLSNEKKLTSTFKELANETGQEIRMVAIRRLNYGETVDTLAEEIFNAWFPDADAGANQTLLLIDTLTNNAALRTGESAQVLVNPEIAKSVIDETVGNNIRQGDKYNQAFIDTGDRLAAVLSGQEDPGPLAIADDIQVEGTFTKAEDTDQGSATVWVIGFLILATVIPMATYFWYVGFPGGN